MKEGFDKEEFLKDIHTIPSWVKNADDLLKFCKHLHYRLLQQQAICAWYQEQIILNDDMHYEVNKIQCKYDRAYNNDKSEFLPAKEIFNC